MKIPPKNFNANEGLKKTKGFCRIKCRWTVYEF